MSTREEYCTHLDKEYCDCDWCRVIAKQSPSLSEGQKDILNAAEAIFDARVTSGGGDAEGAFETACRRLSVPCDWSKDWPVLCGYLTRYAKSR